MKDWIYDHIRLRALYILLAAVGILIGASQPAKAAQTRTFTITKSAGYFDGTPFGTEVIVYLVYDAANDKQLFSTQNLVTTRSDIPDGAKCFYVRPAVLNVTADGVLPGTLGDASPNSCPTNPPAKKVGATTMVVQ